MSSVFNAAVRLRVEELLKATLGTDDKEELLTKLLPVVDTLSASFVQAMARGELDELEARHLQAQLANLEAASALLTRKLIADTLEEALRFGLRTLVGAMA